MNFLEKTIEVLDNEMTNLDKIIAVCDILIPKIMYIPTAQVAPISLKIIQLRSNFHYKSQGYFIAQVLFAFLEYKIAHFDYAIELMQEINKDVSDDIPMVHRASGCVVVGVSNRSLGNRELALEYLQKALEEYGKEPDLAHQQYFYGLALYHIGEMYGEMKDYDEMLDKNIRFLEYAEKWNNIDFINRALNSMGIAYLGKKEYDSCLKYLKLADEKIKQAANLPFVARNLNDLGRTYFQLQDYQKSIDYYKQSLKIRKEIKDTNAIITTLISLSQVHRAKEDFETSINLLHEAEAIAEPLNVISKIYQIYQELSLVYEKSKQFENALIYYKKFHTLKEEVDNVNKTQIENQKIREANTQLRQQKNLIEEQKQKIETSVLKLKEANKYLESFATVAAHDLKAPIRIAANFSKLIERKYKDSFDQNDKEYFKFLTDNIGLLAKMIDNLLSLSKLDKNLPRPEIFDTTHSLSIALERLKDKIVISNAQITINGVLPTIQAHESLVIQLFQNIIDNAIKYMSKDAPQILITSAPDDNKNYHQFEIKDNGVGIPEDKQPYIFDLFNEVNRQDSSGIGLATCKKIVTHYGGKIWVRSSLNEGTSIFFTLPSYKVRLN
jgi:signal transduction histidine kinase